MRQEQVNHPSHYNQHPAGIECIDIIRHYVCDIANAIKYLWRAGLKPEMGLEDVVKEIEDLKKSIWYIQDYLENRANDNIKYVQKNRINTIVNELTDHTIQEITHGYQAEVAEAMTLLLYVGVIRCGDVRHAVGWPYLLREAIEHINKRIFTLHEQLADKDISDMQNILAGNEVEGLHTAKPGGKRDDEPQNYDPLNLIIIQGTAYGLTSEVHRKENGALYSPCEICVFRECCDINNRICVLHQANNQEYYREVGSARYQPSYGTIEVYDELKAAQKELEELEKEG